MRTYFFLVLAAFIWTGCNETPKPTRPEVENMTYRPLKVESEDGRYTEWYPGHKQVKISGRYDKDGQKTGVWKFFSELGVELSITVYSKGLKSGHIIVKHPNGALHYTGEYWEDEPVGEWKFYDEQGVLKEVKEY